ncbi:MAG: hypothetical protein NT155_00090 [Candidatus Staskawiczbacteria bacterium]|nr:hypothetical protein [Candidatus Staskawiczbacteria bacterium]
MEKQKDIIRAIFTDKANTALAELIKDFGLEETVDESIEKDAENKLSNIVIIDRLAKDFTLGSVSEVDLTNSLQKDLGVSQQVAERISKQIITKIVPFIEKVSEEKLKDPVFAEELSKKVFTEQSKTIPASLGNKKIGPAESSGINRSSEIGLEPTAADPTEKIITPPATKEAKIKSSASVEKPSKIKKSAATPIEEVKKSTIQARQTKGPDNYREPIG